jgi:hypothetical protein
MQREQLLGAAGPITEKCRGRHWILAASLGSGDRKLLEERTQLGLGERGMNEGESFVQTGSVWIGIGIAEKKNGQVLDCCVDNQCFACGRGILGESRGKCLNAWNADLWAHSGVELLQWEGNCGNDRSELRFQSGECGQG